MAKCNIDAIAGAEIMSRFSEYLTLEEEEPYVLSTRRGKQYRCEMTDNDHLHLLDVLKRHKGPVLISGYQDLMYDIELRG